MRALLAGIFSCKLCCIPHARARSDQINQRRLTAVICCIPHARARSDLRIASQQMRKLRTCAHPRAYRPLTPKRGGRTNFLLRVRDFFDRREMITLAEYLGKSFGNRTPLPPCHVLSELLGHVSQKLSPFAFPAVPSLQPAHTAPDPANVFCGSR